MSFSLSRLGFHYSHLGDQDEVYLLDAHPGANLLLETLANLLLEDGVSVLLLEP